MAMRAEQTKVLTPTAGTPPPSASPTPAPTVIALHVVAMLALGALLAWTRWEEYGALLIAPFAASSMLAIAAPDLPFSQPRAVIGGNVFAALSGIAAFAVLGEGALTLVVAAALAMGIMLATRTAHAPAAATAIVAANSDASWGFAAFPVLAGAIVIVAFAFLYHRVVRRSVYPRQWKS